MPATAKAVESASTQTGVPVGRLVEECETLDSTLASQWVCGYPASLSAGESVALDSSSWNASTLVLAMLQDSRRRSEVVMAESYTVDLPD